TASAFDLDNSVENPYAAGSLDVTVNLVPPQLTIGGADSVDEGMPYQLALRSFDANGEPITGWTIHWGDGTVQTIAGSPPQATHFYTLGGQTHTITASASNLDGTFDAG